MGQKLEQLLKQAIDILVDDDARDVSQARLEALLDVTASQAAEVMLGLSRLGLVKPDLTARELERHVIYPLDVGALKRYGHSNLSLRPEPRPRTRPSELAERRGLDGCLGPYFDL